MLSKRWVLGLLAAVAPFVSAGVSNIYWPIASPSASAPWVIGQKNIVTWQTGGGTGIQVFDIQLHNSDSSVLNGFYHVALRVPMERLPGGYKNYGGEMEVDLDSSIPAADNYILIFINTYTGAVYARSQKFTIYETAPGNYTSGAYPTATQTASISGTPAPTDQWAVTLNGPDADATTSAQQIAGNAGSGNGA